MNPKSLSVALLSWRRQYHLPEIVENLRRFPQCDDITIWQNEHAPTAETLALGCRVIHSPENVFTYGRFMAAKESRHSTVFFQDDDVLTLNLPALIEAYERMDGQVAACNLADDGHSRHWKFWQDFKPGYNLLGFGSIMPKRFGEILDRWPFDPALKQRKADVIVTACHSTLSLRVDQDGLSRLKHLGVESGRDSNALWLRGDHKSLTAKAIECCSRWDRSIDPSCTPLS